VSRFGSTTLGLGYSVFVTDALIASAFPSNTARSGVLYPLAFSLAEAAGAKPGDDSRRRVGTFLMFSGVVSLSLSSALWLTAMAANKAKEATVALTSLDILSPMSLFGLSWPKVCT
jgi:DASS family divalent anion:Na+ symporter